MDEEPEVRGAAAEDEAGAEPERAAPIESRFLYVDVAAQRAKQLRQGAASKLEQQKLRELAGGSEAGGPDGPRPKHERVAMREVKDCKIRYEVPDAAPPAGE